MKNNSKVKELIRKILREESVLLQLRRNADLSDLDKKINRTKTVSFSRNGTIDSSVSLTLNKVADEIVPHEEIEDGEDPYAQLFVDTVRHLKDIYGSELTEYFKKRKDEYFTRNNDRDSRGVAYHFVKHSGEVGDPNSRGFRMGFNHFYDLVNEYGNWVDIDWDKVKEKLDTITEFPKKTNWGWESRPLRLISKGDEGNDFDFNLSIIKSVIK